jgi:hypothetical protein
MMTNDNTLDAAIEADRLAWLEQQAGADEQVWTGQWTSSFDGSYELRSEVIRRAGELIPCVAASRFGGEPQLSCGTPCMTLQEAIRQAKELTWSWVTDYCD